MLKIRTMYKFFLLCLCITNSSFAQYFQAPIDTVLYFHPGKGQNVGQDSSYFPANIFNLPDSAASENVGSANPNNICSLGLGGEIVVGFKNYFIIDSDGPDFTIFENAFINPITKKVFAEPGIVSVSEDGINFVEFPFDSLTLEGCAGTRPTYGKANPYDPTVSGGNSFDIEKIGFKKARFIKIKDFSEFVLNNKSHPFYDPTISGFDLDAVVGIHLEPISSSISTENNISTCFSVYFERLGIEIETNETITIIIFDSIGRILTKNVFIESSTIDLSNYPDGIFLINLQCNSQSYLIKLLVSGEKIFLYN